MCALAKYSSSILNTSAVMYTFQNITAKLMGVNDKELTLTYIKSLTWGWKGVGGRVGYQKVLL